MSVRDENFTPSYRQSQHVNRIAFEIASKLVELSHGEQVRIESKVRELLGCQPYKRRSYREWTAREVRDLYYNDLEPELNANNPPPWCQKMAAIINGRLLKDIADEK